MPSRLEGGDQGKIALSGVANNPVEVRILLLQLVYLHVFILWSDGTLADMPSCLGGGEFGINVV
jgi:hypothetical protein